MRKILKHPILIILSITLLTLFFAFQLPKAELNNEVKIFLAKMHPARVNKRYMEKIFGSEDSIAIAIKEKNGSFLTYENIKLIGKLIEKFEKLDHVDKVDALNNTDFIDGSAEGMVVNKIVAEQPKTYKDLENIKAKLIDWRSVYSGNLFSKDFSATTILIKLKPNSTIKDKTKLYYDVKKILSAIKRKDLEIYMAGEPVVTVMLGKNMERDLKNLVPFVILIVILSLGISFKRISGVILPLLSVLISSIWAIGLMALFKVQLTLLSTVIPVVLIAVGTAYGIHILSHYFDKIDASGGNLTKEEHKEIIFKILREVGVAVLLAGLTTIAGFISLVTSQLVPMRSFAIFTTIGVLVALFSSLLLIPSILLLRQHSVKQHQKMNNEDSLIVKFLLWIYKLMAGKSHRILATAVILIIISLFGMSKIVVESPMINFFKPDTDIKKSDNFLNKNFNGTNVLSVIVEGKKKGDLTDPDILKAMDNLKIALEKNFSHIKRVTTFSDFIKRMNKVMHYPSVGEATINNSQQSAPVQDSGSFGVDAGSFASEDSGSFAAAVEEEKPAKKKKNIKKVDIKAPSKEKVSEKKMLELLNGALVAATKTGLTADEYLEALDRKLNYKGEAYNEVPYDISKYPAESKKDLKNLVSQYLLLYSGSLDDFIDDSLEPQKARMIIQVDIPDNHYMEKIENYVKNYTKNYFPKGYTIKLAGTADMNLAVNKLVVPSQLNSVLSSLLIVLIIIAISFKSVKAGFYGIATLITSILINYGIMGFLGIKLDVGTSMAASIAIGIGVDYTIHFMETYKRFRQESSDVDWVTQNTIITTGKAIIFNALSVAFGFAVLMFSTFIPIANFGLLIFVTMLTSSLSAMLILPALFKVFKPQFLVKNK